MSKTYNNVIKLNFADYAIIYQRKVVKNGNWYIRIKKDNGGYFVKSLKTNNKNRALTTAKSKFKEFCNAANEKVEGYKLSLKVPRGSTFSPSGLYEIRNKQTNQVYIGYSINITKRWSSHRSALSKGKHKNSRLQKSWNRWGHWNFSWNIIELRKLEEDSCLYDRQVFTETLKKRELDVITKHIKSGDKLYNKLN